MTAPLPFLPDDGDERTRRDRGKLAPPITGAAAASQAYLQGLSGGITVGTAGIFLASFFAALSFHLVVAAGAASVPMPKPQQRVQMEIYKPPPPPPEPEPLPEPEPEPPPKEEPKPKPKPPPKEPPPKETLPPPPSNQEPPPEAPSEPVPLVTGISMSSTVTNSGGPSVRVGNTTYGDPNKEKFTKPNDVKAYAGGSEDFAPVRTANVSSPATVLREHRPRYPRQLKDEGIEGVVILRVQVTRDGKTRKVKLVKGLHPVLDALSLQSMERFVWKAAQVDGQPVDSVITYRMTWELFD